MKLPLNHRPHAGNHIATAMKAVALVAVAWGLVYPTLLWSLRGLLS